MSLNNNGVITYEDFVVSENEHSDAYEYTSESESSSDSEDSEYEPEEKESEETEETVISSLKDNEEVNTSTEKDEYEEEKKDDYEDSEEETEKESTNEIKFIEKKSNTEKIKRQPKIINECSICADTLNRSNRKEIKCLFCNYSACRSCIEQYLIQSTENICMNCKAIWNREFLDDNLTKVFMKGKYKKRREDILMEKQKALLQSTLPIAETRKKAKIRLEEINERRGYLYEQIRLMNVELNKMETEGYHLRNQLTTTRVDENLQKKQFVKKCPNGECRGFLSTRWKCGLCNINVCSECHEIKETTVIQATNNNENNQNNENNENNQNPQHVCKPENVETAKLIFKDCKNCPKCGTYIYKIDGCDQLFCTNCHTAFSWRTGQIETGRIHNPHYYEWLRKSGKQQRELLDIPCGGIPQVYNMRSILDGRIEYGDDLYLATHQLIQRNYIPSIYNTIRLVTHIQDVNLRNFQQDIERIRGKELDLRCQYLMNEIDEEEWKITLQQNEYKLEYLTDLSQLYQMFSTVSSDIILFIYNTGINLRPKKIPCELIIEKMDEIYELITYFNNHSQKLAKRFTKKRYDCINNFSIEKCNV